MTHISFEISENGSRFKLHTNVDIMIIPSDFCARLDSVLLKEYYINYSFRLYARTFYRNTLNYIIYDAYTKIQRTVIRIHLTSRYVYSDT